VNAFPYYKSLDGIRGIAVMMVMMLHSRLMPFGWVGVQIFFVLSGFLITSILLRQTDRPFSLFIRRFYWRRGLRIWPLYFLFLLLCAIGYFIWQVPENWLTARAWLATFTYNFGRISPQFADSDYVGHFWTLAIEEQFYLVWPFACFFLPQNYFRRFVSFVILAGPVFRYLAGIYFVKHGYAPENVAKAVDSLPTSHVDAFASGTLIAVMPNGLRERLAGSSSVIFFLVLGITIIAGLVQTWCMRTNGLPPNWQRLGYGDVMYYREYIWAFSLLNLTSAALIFCAMQNNAISRSLAWRPLAYVGLISYGLYVWHLPLMRVFALIWPVPPHSLMGVIKFALYTFVSIGLAATSYFGFEKYFLNLKKSTLAALLKPNQSLEQSPTE
jgi:peptidoglycan/LPS O-acetylase OafA/YrhL